MRGESKPGPEHKRFRLEPSQPGGQGLDLASPGCNAAGRRLRGRIRPRKAARAGRRRRPKPGRRPRGALRAMASRLSRPTRAAPVA